MLTPSIGALKSRYPDARIDLLTLHQYVRDAFQSHPRLNKITALPVYPGEWFISHFVNRSGLRLLMSAIRYCPEQLLGSSFSRYDIGINFALHDFDRNLGNAFLYLLAVRRRVGTVGVSDGFLTDRVTIDYGIVRRVAGHLSLLKPLGIVSEHRDYEFPVDKTDLDAIRNTLHFKKRDASKPLAVIHPGGKVHVNSRRWPAVHYARLCHLLSVEGYQVILTGDTDDQSICDEVAHSLGNEALSLAGQLSFAKTAALLSSCELCVTNDTSILHLAEAMNVRRIVSIFGPTDPDLLAPQSERNVVLRSDLSCAPCMGGLIDGKSERCWRQIKEECLWQITPEQVIKIVVEHADHGRVPSVGTGT